MKLFANHPSLRAADHTFTQMKYAAYIALVSVAVLSRPGALTAHAAENDGVALAIIYDTSGSMKDSVRDQSGRQSPKYLIANRALQAIAKQIQTFTTHSASGEPRKIHTALFTFSGNGAHEVIKFGPFDAKTIEDWARHFSSPSGNTPLGNSLDTAARVILDSPLPRKHVLIITDGMNTAGPQPASVLPALKQLASSKQTSLSVHFVAFDVDAKVFEPIKKLGATVVSAADEPQLNTQLQFILQRKILLEEEEPRK